MIGHEGCGRLHDLPGLVSSLWAPVQARDGHTSSERACDSPPAVFSAVGVTVQYNNTALAFGAPHRPRTPQPVSGCWQALAGFGLLWLWLPIGRSLLPTVSRLALAAHAHAYAHHEPGPPPGLYYYCPAIVKNFSLFPPTNPSIRPPTHHHHHTHCHITISFRNTVYSTLLPFC